MNRIEKHFLKRILHIWMKKIEARFSDSWNLTEVEKAHFTGKYQAYKEILEVLEGKVPIGIPEPNKKKKKVDETKTTK